MADITVYGSMLLFWSFFGQIFDSFLLPRNWISLFKVLLAFIVLLMSFLMAMISVLIFSISVLTTEISVSILLISVLIVSF